MQQSGEKEDLFSTIRKVKEMVSFARELGGSGDGSDSVIGLIRDLIGNVPEMTEAIGDLVMKVKMAEAGERSDAEDSEEETSEFPEGFDQYVKKIKDATDDGDRIGATLRTFQFLGQDKRWRAPLLAMLKKVKGGHDDEVLGFLQTFLDKLVESDRLDKRTADIVVLAFKKNLDKVTAVLTGAKKQKPAEPTKEEPSKTEEGKQS